MTTNTLVDLEMDNTLFDCFNKNAKLDPDDPALRLPDDSVLAIPMDTFMRKDPAQVIIYGREFLDLWCYRLLPAQAAMVALFDGQRTLGEISSLIQGYAGGSKALNDYKARRVLAWLKYGNGDREVLIDRRAEPHRPFKTYDPSQFYIPAEQVHIASRLHAPVSLLLMPTSACFTDCVYCYATRRPIAQKDLLSDSRIKELLDEAAEIGVIQLNLDGGDALCRKNIVDLIAYAIRRNLSVDVSTKAYISPDLAKALFDAGLTVIQLGFDAPTPELFDKIVGRKGHFEKTIQSIRNCANAGISPRTNSILTFESVGMIHQLIDLLHTLPLRDMKIAPAFRSIYRHRDNLLLTDQQKIWLREQIEILMQKYPEGKIKFECKDDYMALNDGDKAKEFENFPRCGAGTETMIVAPDGKVVMCEQSPHTDEFVVGNVKHQSLLEVWQGEKMSQFKQVPREQFKGSVCYDCEDFEDCVHERGGCYVMTLKAYGTRYAPHPACPKAPPYAVALE